MAKKRQYSADSPGRLANKFRLLIAARYGLPPDHPAVEEAVREIASRYASNYAPYRDITQKVRKILERMDVDMKLLGFAKAFASEAKRKAEAGEPVDTLIDKYKTVGLREDVMYAILDTLGIAVKRTRTEAKPAS
jgi:hypothetical protein